MEGEEAAMSEVIALASWRQGQLQHLRSEPKVEEIGLEFLALNFLRMVPSMLIRGESRLARQDSP